MIKRKYRTDEEWLSLIQECRSSGLTDKQWSKRIKSVRVTFITRSKDFVTELVKSQNLNRKQP